MPRVVIKFAEHFAPERLASLSGQLAAALARQTVERIEAGGDPGNRFAPRVLDGGRALANPGFLNRIKGFQSDRGFGAGTDFVNARRLLLGTTGKGGTEEPIRPKRGTRLTFKSGGSWHRFLKSEYAPRGFFALTDENVAEFGRIIVGGK